MTEIRKVPASAGAEWLLGGFALFRRAPLALGLLGLIWGGLSTLASMTGQLWLSFPLALLGPILFGGVVYAAREVEQGRAALPGHLVQGVREGKVPRLLTMLLPQLLAVIILVTMLFAMLGQEQLQQLMLVVEQMETNPDPQLAETLPAGRMFGWMLIALAVGLLAGFFTFAAIPEVMFTDRPGLESMALSFRACVRNIGAMAVLILLTLIAMLAISLAVQLVVLVLGLALGTQPAAFIGQVLLLAVVLPVMGGAVFYAWRQMLGGDGTERALVQPVDPGGFEA